MCVECGKRKGQNSGSRVQLPVDARKRLRLSYRSVVAVNIWPFISMII